MYLVIFWTKNWYFEVTSQVILVNIIKIIIWCIGDVNNGILNIWNEFHVY